MSKLTLKEAKEHILIDPVRRDDGYFWVYVKYKEQIYKFIYTDYVRVKCVLGECWFYTKQDAYNDIYQSFLIYKKRGCLW